MWMYKRFFLLIILLNSCYPFMEYMQVGVFDHIDNCQAEYYKYHINAYNKEEKSKICSRVKNRMCILNKYCKGDKECIKEVWRVYPDNFTKGTDTEYCITLVKYRKEYHKKHNDYKGYFYCDKPQRDDKFCKKYDL